MYCVMFCEGKGMIEKWDLKSLETMSRASSSLAPGTRKQGVTVLLAVTPFTFMVVISPHPASHLELLPSIKNNCSPGGLHGIQI